MFGLTGKVALITGASRGIGRACARTLAAQGAYVVVNYRHNEAAARCALDEVVAAGGKGELACFDVGEEAASRHAIQEAARRLGRLDLLINNAGVVQGEDLLLRLPSDGLERMLRTNVLGAFYCSKAALSFMMRKRFGRVVTISSVVARTGNVGQTAYAASKAALEGFTRSLAREYGPKGITANVVAPGLIETDMTAHLGADGLAAAATQIPLRRVGTAQDVAAVVTFLCSEEAGYVTGQVIGADGGLAM